MVHHSYCFLVNQARGAEFTIVGADRGEDPASLHAVYVVCRVHLYFSNEDLTEVLTMLPTSFKPFNYFYSKRIYPTILRGVRIELSGTSNNPT
jgi:hypothetical protein